MSSIPITEEIPLPPNIDSSSFNNSQHQPSLDFAYAQSNYNLATYYSNSSMLNQQAAAYYTAYQTNQSYNTSHLNPIPSTYPYYYSLNQLQQQSSVTNVINQNFGPGEKLSRKQRKKLAAAAAAAADATSYEPGERSVDQDDADDDPTIAKGPKSSKANNFLPIWGNEKTMNLNPLLLTNIQNSPYFKSNLYSLKTYHEVIDEIWYSVKHLEPWEKGSRRVSAQNGMCGSVRGVGAGGIVSTPFCILYKLYTLRLTRKQVMGLIKHKDSPYIRAIGFMYIRYTQPPEHLWSWLSPFFEDKEEFDPKAGGGQKMTIGAMCRNMLIKLDWFSTLFPRIPVPIQKDIEKKLNEYDMKKRLEANENYEEGELDENEDLEKDSNYQDVNYFRDYKNKNRESKDYKFKNRSRSRSRSRSKSKSRNISKERSKRRYRSSSRSKSEEKRRSKHKYSESKKNY